MKNIFSIFEENSLLPLFRALPEIKEIDTLVWYPSSGYDFRHIFDDFFSDKGKQKIYLHTDISSLNWDYDSMNKDNPLFKKEKFLSQYNKYVTCLDFFELKLISNYYYPCYEVLYQGFRNKGKNEGRVYCFLLKIGANEDKIVPLIYACFENTNFFYDYILESKIQITELVHIRDGGQSFGSSKLKMDYIYLYLDRIGVQKIKLDFSLETKLKNAIRNFGRFHYYNPLRIKNKLEEIKTDFNSRQSIQTFIQTETDKWIEVNVLIRNQLKYELEKIIGTDLFRRKREQQQYDYLYLRKINTL